MSRRPDQCEMAIQPPTKADKLISLIESVQIPSTYQMRVSDLQTLYDRYPGRFELMGAAFAYGFLRGQRFTENERRKRSRPANS